MIPKIIHYCWLSNDPIPKDLQKYMKTWKKKLPDYEFMLWNFNRFDINSSIWVKQAFEAKKYAFACDYIRLYAVYHYGGIYMDMDVEVVKSFNDILRKDYLLGYETEEALEAGIFGASPKAEWVKDALDYYQDREFINPDSSINNKPLPQILYSILNKKYIQTQILQPFPNEYLTANSYSTRKVTKTSKTYTIHHFAGSWFSFKDKLIERLSKIIGESGIQILVKIKQTILNRLK